MNYIGLIVDAVVILIIALLAALGIKRGLVKTCLGLVSTIIVLVVAVVAVNPLVTFVFDATTYDEQLRQKLESPIAGALPNAYAKVYFYDMDSDVETPDELIFEKDNTKDKFENIFATSAVKSFGLHKIIQPQIEDILAEQGADLEAAGSDEENSIYFIDAITIPVTTYIFLAVGFILIAIVARIVIAILLRLLKKAISKLYVMHFLDKMLGGVFGLAIGCLVIFITLTIVQLMSSFAFMAPVNNFLEGTYVTKALMQNNILYTFLVQKVDLSELLGKFTLTA